MKIICVGRNYADHAREMQAQRPASPVLFLKPETALLPGGGRFVLPAFSQSVHYECELVLRIGAAGTGIPPAEAWAHVDGIGLGIDFTARDLQSELKAAGLPWEKAKAFDGSAPVSAFRPPAGNSVSGWSAMAQWCRQGHPQTCSSTCLRFWRRRRSISVCRRATWSLRARRPGWDRLRRATSWRGS